MYSYQIYCDFNGSFLSIYQALIPIILVLPERLESAEPVSLFIKHWTAFELNLPLNASD